MCAGHAQCRQQRVKSALDDACSCARGIAGCIDRNGGLHRCKLYRVLIADAVPDALVARWRVRPVRRCICMSMRCSTRTDVLWPIPLDRRGVLQCARVRRSPPIIYDDPSAPAAIATARPAAGM